MTIYWTMTMEILVQIQPVKATKLEKQKESNIEIMGLENDWATRWMWHVT